MYRYTKEWRTCKKCGVKFRVTAENAKGIDLDGNNNELLAVVYVVMCPECHFISDSFDFEQSWSYEITTHELVGNAMIEKLRNDGKKNVLLSQIKDYGDAICGLCAKQNHRDGFEIKIHNTLNEIKFYLLGGNHWFTSDGEQCFLREGITIEDLNKEFRPMLKTFNWEDLNLLIHPLAVRKLGIKRTVEEKATYGK